MTNEQLEVALRQCKTVEDARKVCFDVDKHNIDVSIEQARKFAELCPEATPEQLMVFAVVMGYMGSKKFYGDGRIYSEADIESEGKSHIDRLMPEEGEDDEKE